MSGQAIDIQYRFRCLTKADDPIAGLFFLQSEEPEKSALIERAEEPVVATGISFLIHETGLVATCTHVVDAVGSMPGQSVKLYGVSRLLPIVVEAKVLYEGWQGPPYDEKSGFPESPYWHGYYDKRPELFKQDVAFLQIDPDTAKPHVAQVTASDGSPKVIPVRPGAEIPDNPRQVLLDQARVLPIGVPGYQVKGAALQAWWVLWQLRAPDPHPGYATFLGTERSLYDIVRIQSIDIRPGFSGSPLWDNNRRLVVGMVRRGIKPLLPDAVLATDARAFTRHALVRLSYDKDLDDVLQLVRFQADRTMPTRHAALVDWDDPAIFVEPLIALAQPRDELTGQERAPGTPAIATVLAALVQHTHIQLTGVAGSGKSTILARVAKALLDDSVELDGRRVVPLVVTAAELLAADCDLDRLLSMARAHFGGDLASSESLKRALIENDVALVLCVDGLDEIEGAQHNRMLLRLATAVGPNKSLSRVVLASRPVMATSLAPGGVTRTGYLALELQTLSDAHVEELVGRFFSDEADRSAFLAVLEDVRWDRNGPTPLQVRVAASVFRREGRLGFPKRAIDLAVFFINRLIERAQDTSLLPGRRLPELYTKLYLPDILSILSFLGELSIKTSEPTLDDIERRLDDVASLDESPKWLADIGTLLSFIEHEIPQRTGILWFVDKISDNTGRMPRRLIWMHRTFAEVFAAKWLVTGTHGNVGRLKRIFDDAYSQAFSFVILAEIERSRYMDVVAEILRECMSAPVSEMRRVITALRALAAGIDADGIMRAPLVRLLVRILLTEHAEAKFCAEILTSDELPSPLKIAARPDLRAEVITALAERWRMRYSRIQAEGSRAPVKITTREALILDKLGMWSEFAVPLADPRVQTDFDKNGGKTLFGPPVMSHASAAPGAVTTILMRNRDGVMTPLTLDSRTFINDVVELGRVYPSMSGTELVGLYVELLVKDPRRKQRGF